MKERLLVEELDAQKCAHTLGERLLERDQLVLRLDGRQLGGGVHCAILREHASVGKLILRCGAAPQARGTARVGSALAGG